MKRIRIAAMALFCIFYATVSAQTNNAQTLKDKYGNPMLLGQHTETDLQEIPYKEWYDKNYADYTLDTLTLNKLKPYLKNKQFEIFMGTWCGDSRREVPRMFKLLKHAGVQPAQIKLIMVDNHDSSYKQSPTHEEKGKNILRVPNLIVYEGGKEINRVVESPVISLEEDLLSIASAAAYRPNYAGALYLQQMADKQDLPGLRRDSIQLIGLLQQQVSNSAELNSLGYWWLNAGETGKALLAFELNTVLFPTDPNVFDILAEINLRLNNKEKARALYQKVLTLKPESEHAKKMLAQIQQ